MPDSSLKLAVFYDAENISPYAVPRIFSLLERGRKPSARGTRNGAE